MVSADTNTKSAVIELSGVGKHYQLYKGIGDRLKSAFLSRSASGNVFRALDDVSLNIKSGEFLGIIGRNGSGKSTLLELVCGISQPSSGTVSVNGTVSALLELGAGFNPELTGHDNIYLNGNILGLSNRDIDKYYERIVDFADIGEFLHEPVKIYSSGMYVRLAFAVQACIEPDVLIVDEALAVGDIFFRQKCYQYIDKLISKGTTVILVTHAMGDIEQFCTRALLLDHGKAVFVGDPAEAVKRYYLLNQPALAGSAPTDSEAERPDNTEGIHWPVDAAAFKLSEEAQISEGRAYCTRYTILDDAQQVSHSFQHGASIVVLAEFVLHEDVPVPVFGVELVNDRGIIVHGKTSLELDTPVPQGLRGGTRITFKQKIGLNLAPGEYTLTFGLSCIALSAYEARYDASHSDLYASIVRLCNLQKCVVFGVHFPVVPGEVHLKHHGIADLPGECCADYGYLSEDDGTSAQEKPANLKEVTDEN